MPDEPSDDTRSGLWEEGESLRRAKARTSERPWVGIDAAIWRLAQRVAPTSLVSSRVDPGTVTAPASRRPGVPAR